ncbi:CheR family methyltransferase [Mesorhizobium sp.]|uniref:CheR family methyltransferase n=1 Tax=Mesorhizobium sp. TaxID=1871066 RepID=UPI00120DDB30|nr:CheR family methyltransferase [Mesorhizobium sp.]TIN22187.1 MAG: PAS domain-containing protein [Mesorhizobium sp.]TIN39335.1 MAG: PAS domain-containing protein [Mesorhizobium sp.]TJU89583.1 MAG: PAS domain-containing protein [Mesorhizobium sp.]TJU93040.1 MAG: PAS domain-containing protein [Mesorhizobium sp.]
MTSQVKRFPIVGVGASAGGIPAMEGLFKGITGQPGMAFVIVTHLSPERESLLHEVVGRYTQLPVVVVEDGTTVLSDHVYVMPQNVVLTIERGVLHLRPSNVLSRERKPIDIFFSALAEDQSEYAVGVILSGGDSDGTLGAKAIKERGGLTVAQAPDGYGPRNPDMPKSAISSGLIDIAAPAEEIGAKLEGFARSFDMLNGVAGGGEHETAELGRLRDEIYGILQGQSGHDFSGYKTKTFLRRIKRRMQIGQLDSIEEYVEWLKKDPREVANLFRDLLINVTDFFRDPDAFKLLEDKVVPQLFEGKTASDAVRIWVPGCATGEEVFSIGMLLREHMETLSVVPRVQIFATDIDEPALAVARAARYPAALLQGVSPERKQRFFSSDGESYVLANEVRELCVFSPHSIVRDPPFSRMDMVSCRNLLIYFGSDIQNRVLPIFHYALKPGGYLFLGTSESVGQHDDLFATVDKKQRIFQAREHASPHIRLPMLIGDGRSGAFLPEGTGPNKRTASYPLRQTVEAQVLERFAPPHVVVNGDGDVVYYSARTGSYLEAPQGIPSRQVLSLARAGLRLDLRAALREAATTRRTVVRENVVIDEDDEQAQSIKLTVEPLAERGKGERLYLVLFEPTGPVQARSDVGPENRSSEGAADLERELRETRERLQSTVEEYETALEELKSSNEELVSVNEEAQSTNEELEASKEEMQSLNEELNTINSELTSKIEELDRANSDLRNLFESTQIATIFLDRNLVVRTFTPAASSFFSLRPSDVGRPLTELSSQLDYPELKQHIDAVFETGETLNHHLARDNRGRFYMVRINPYRDKDNRIQGVVVTLVDVTTLAETEEQNRVLISELNHRVKNMLAVVASIANRTRESSESKEEFAEALIGRLHAMSRAYGLLSKERWKEASINELLHQELEPFSIDRFELDGAEVKLSPQQGLSLSMAIHELATNAAKYGALSKPEGRIVLKWFGEGDMFTLAWRERHGPPVRKPEVSGFGLSLLQGEIGYRLGGNVETTFNRDGLEVQITFPMLRKETP